MKTIMILGGGYYQTPLIKRSVELGYHTVVCGIQGNYPGYSKADKWIDVDTFDKEACLAVARNEKIDGVIVCGTDAVMPTIGYIVDNLNLPGPSYRSTILASNKAEMKAAFKATGVRTADYEKIRSVEEADAFALSHSFPVVLKIVDASGSRGVEIIKSRDSLFEHFDAIKALSNKDYLVIEEFISGIEFGAQAFVRDGQIQFIMPHGDILFHSQTDVPIGHYAPFEHADGIEDDIRRQLELCIKALGIDNTAINADFMLKDGHVYVIEIGARAGATCLPELVSVHMGFDYYEYLLRNCVGEKMSVPHNEMVPALVETLISKRSGVVKHSKPFDAPKEVVSFDIYPKSGDKISAFRNAFDRIGTVVMKGGDIPYLISLSKKILTEVDAIYELI